MPLDNNTSAAAQRISDYILSAAADDDDDDGILAISIMDIKGNILAAKSKQSFKETFGLASDGEKYGGILAIATLSLVNEVKNIFGEAQAIITIHDNCKLMLLPMPSYRLLIGLVLQRSVNAEDGHIANKIERLLAAARK
jgi:hypothetical protein